MIKMHMYTNKGVSEIYSTIIPRVGENIELYGNWIVKKVEYCFEDNILSHIRIYVEEE